MVLYYLYYKAYYSSAHHFVVAKRVNGGFNAENYWLTDRMEQWVGRRHWKKLMPLVEVELRRIAANYMRREGPGHTLQTTALINEAYLKLIDQREVRWQNRAQFFALASTLMRRILLNHGTSESACETRWQRCASSSGNAGSYHT